MAFGKIHIMKRNNKKGLAPAKNFLFQGDNLKIIETLISWKNENKFINSNGNSGFQTIYIDPPFAKDQKFKTKHGEEAYSDKLTGDHFLQFLRERVVLLKELLSPTGVFYLHLDRQMGHYVKVLLDSIFGQNFLGEIIVKRIKKSDKNANFFNTATDSLYVYSKTKKWIYNPIPLKVLKKGYWHSLDAPGTGAARTFFGQVLPPPIGRHWMWNQKRITEAEKQKKLRLHPRTGKPEYWISPNRLQYADSNWTDIPAYSFKTGYPTEKSEILLSRVISASSNEQDWILDAFAGSGTTGLTASKLNRKWVLVDSSTLAIRIIKQRMGQQEVSFELCSEQI
jgi:adenine-specific DNA-methyltransferase